MTPPSPPTGIVRTLGEVAKAFGVSRDTVRKDWRAAGMPGRPGHYDLAEIAEWKRLRSSDPDEDLGDEQTKAMRRRKLGLENQIKELETQRRTRLEHEASGDLVSRKEVEAEVAQRLQIIRRRLGTIPRLMTTRFPQELKTSLTEELRRLIDQVLTALVIELQKAPRTPKAEEESQEDRPSREPGPAKKKARRKPKQGQGDQPID